MRFTKPAYPTAFFSNKIWVKCPKCSKNALVSSELGKYIVPFPYNHKSELHCDHCGLKRETDQEWFGFYQGFVSRACGFCGSHISFSSKPTKEPFQAVRLKCDKCNNEKDYSLDWYRYKENKPTDPYFGLDLLLQINIKDNTLWIYNLDHLRYLREYVASKIREDDGRHKYSMISNLPQWIKSAKNRDLIVKRLDKIEKQFVDLTAHNKKYT